MARETYGRVILALIITVLLRLPAYVWPAISDDEGIYDAMAQVLNQGGVMYRDVIDHKPPGLAYSYAFVEHLVGAEHAGPRGMAGVHTLGLLAALLTGIGLYWVARELLPAPLRWWPPLLYGVASASKCAYDGLAVNGELLMNVPTVFAVWAVVAARRHRPKAVRAALDVLAGALVGVAALYKWQAVLVGLAFPFFGSWEPQAAWLRHLLLRGPRWLLGLALPLAGVAAYFYAHGVLPEAVAWGLRFNAQYVAEGPAFFWALQRFVGQLGAVVLPSALLYVAALRGARRTNQAGLLVWTVGSLFSVCIGGRFFGHYFLQLELPLCLLAPEAVDALWRRHPVRLTAALGIPALVFTALALTPQGTRALLDGGDPDWEATGRAIRARVAPDESLFVWGNAPLVYHHAQRGLGTRLPFCNYLTGLSPGTPSEYDPTVHPNGQGSAAWPALLADLDQRQPAWVLDTAAGGWKGYSKFPMRAYAPLKAHIDAFYTADSVIDGAILYRRTGID